MSMRHDTSSKYTTVCTACTGGGATKVINTKLILIPLHHVFGWVLPDKRPTILNCFSSALGLPGPGCQLIVIKHPSKIPSNVEEVGV